jgi:hypothetical protein
VSTNYTRKWVKMQEEPAVVLGVSKLRH